MPTVALDTRDAFVPMPHGSGIYTRRLAGALRSTAGSDGLDYWFLERGGRAPELWWEQVTLPRQMFTGIRENITPTIAAVATLLIIFTTSLLLVLEWLRGRRR